MSYTEKKLRKEKVDHLFENCKCININTDIYCFIYYFHFMLCLFCGDDEPNEK